MRDSTGDFRRGMQHGRAAPSAAAQAIGDEVLAELRGIRADLRDLIAVLRPHHTPPISEAASHVTEKLPPMMTIAEASEMLRTSPRALYQRIRRGAKPGVVRIAPRRFMVKTGEFLRELRRVPTFE
jgi:hypothetical protein